jgi:hypothetical protein
VARFAVEEPEEGHGNTHTPEYTLHVYVRSIDLRAMATHSALLSDTKAISTSKDGTDQTARADAGRPPQSVR